MPLQFLVTIYRPLDSLVIPCTASTTLKYASLLTLTFQNTLLIVSMRYSRLVPPELRYITTTAVVFSEFAKMCICLLIIFFQQKTIKEFGEHLYHHLIEEWKDTLKMSVPAIVYMIQNNLQYVAVSNLEAAVFQVYTVCIALYVKSELSIV